MVFNSGIQVGQVWVDKDKRNNAQLKKGGPDPRRPRKVQILSMPTPSSPGTMVILKAPRHPETVGQKREFTKAKLLAYYGRA